MLWKLCLIYLYWELFGKCKGYRGIEYICIGWFIGVKVIENKVINCDISRVFISIVCRFFWEI